MGLIKFLKEQAYDISFHKKVSLKVIILNFSFARAGPMNFNLIVPFKVHIVMLKLR